MPHAADDSLPDLVARVVDDAKDVARAEVNLVKTRLSAKAHRYRNAAIFFGTALVLVVAALIALIVGLLMAIAAGVGAGYATVIVVGATLAIAAVSAWLGVRQWRLV